MCVHPGCQCSWSVLLIPCFCVNLPAIWGRWRAWISPSSSVLTHSGVHQFAFLLLVLSYPLEHSHEPFARLISSGLLFFFVSSFIFGNGAHPFGVYYISGIALLVGGCVVHCGSFRHLVGSVI
jgi:hypothetical protein